MATSMDHFKAFLSFMTLGTIFSWFCLYVVPWVWRKMDRWERECQKRRGG